MKFDKNVDTKYRDALEEAVETVLERGNKQQKNVAKLAKESNLLIRVVPNDEIGCSGITGLIDNVRTNERINNETLDIVESLGEVYITFSDWTLNVAGQRGCQGTFVHEGLHAYDFAKIIASFSKAESEPENLYDLTLYELEHRAAVTSGEYLVRIGKPDFIDDGLQLSLVSLDENGKPFVDMNGIKFRMQNGYGLNEAEQGAIISEMMGLKPRKTSFSLSRLLGFGN